MYNTKANVIDIASLDNVVYSTSARNVSDRKRHAWMCIGNIFSQIREDLGMTKSHVAREICVSRSTLSRFENGQPIQRAKLVRRAYELYLAMTLDHMPHSPEFLIHIDRIKCVLNAANEIGSFLENIINQLLDEIDKRYDCSFPEFEGSDFFEPDEDNVFGIDDDDFNFDEYGSFSSFGNGRECECESELCDEYLHVKEIQLTVTFFRNLYDRITF